MEILIIILLGILWMIKYIEFTIDYIKNKTSATKRKIQKRVIRIKNKKK